jgi:hypothetical protein
MARTKRTPCLMTALLAFALVLPFVSPAYADVSLDQASADRAAIVGDPFHQLKDELERSFPREEALETWATKIAAQYPSVWYILIANFENKLVYSFYRDEARPHGALLQDAFRGISKFTMQEGVAHGEVGGHRVLATREKLVIEMDTYYFEFGFGPIR